MQHPSTARPRRAIIDDPVALQVVWTRLIAIADEAAATLRRTSFSPIVRESNDFSCVIFDAEGNADRREHDRHPVLQHDAVAHARAFPFGAPGGRMARRRRRHLQRSVADLGPPARHHHTGAGVSRRAPRRLDRQHRAYGRYRRHAVVGRHARGVRGRHPASRPCFTCAKGALERRSAKRSSAPMSRLPEQVLGDIAAQVAAGETAARGLRELSGARRSMTLRRSRARSARAPSAPCATPSPRCRTASIAPPLDLDGTGEEDVHLEVAIEMRGEEMFLDYAGTSPEVGRALNTVMNYTEAYSCYPLKCALDPGDAAQRGHLPHDHGQGARRLDPQSALPGARACPPARRPLPRRGDLQGARARARASASSPNPAARRPCA